MFRISTAKKSKKSSSYFHRTQYRKTQKTASPRYEKPVDKIIRNTPDDLLGPEGLKRKREIEQEERNRNYYLANEGSWMADEKHEINLSRNILTQWRLVVVEKKERFDFWTGLGLTAPDEDDAGDEIPDDNKTAVKELFGDELEMGEFDDELEMEMVAGGAAKVFFEDRKAV